MGYSIHLLVRRPGLPAPVTACGTKVSGRQVLQGRVTHEKAKASCFGCAVEAPDLTQAERQEIWDNRAESLSSFRNPPWVVAQNKKDREEAKVQRAKEAEERRAAREEKRKQREAAAAAKAAARAEKQRASGHPF